MVSLLKTAKWPRVVKIGCMDGGKGAPINDVSVFQHHVDLAKIVYILQWIAIKHKQVRDFARFHSPEVVTQSVTFRASPMKMEWALPIRWGVRFLTTGADSECRGKQLDTVPAMRTLQHQPCRISHIAVN